MKTIRYVMEGYDYIDPAKLSFNEIEILLLDTFNQNKKYLDGFKEMVNMIALGEDYELHLVANTYLHMLKKPSLFNHPSSTKRILNENEEYSLGIFNISLDKNGDMIVQSKTNKDRYRLKCLW